MLMLAVRSVYLSVELVKILLPHLSVEVINAKDEVNNMFSWIPRIIFNYFL